MDTLSWIVTLVDNSFEWTYIEYLEALNINKIKEVQQVAHELSWMDQFIEYLTKRILPDDPLEEKLLKWKASRFVLLDR